MKDMLKGIFILSVFVFFVATAGAQRRQTVTLQATPDAKGASGTIIVEDKGGGQKEIALKAQGLEPNSVYTVWFVNTSPKEEMSGIGQPDYSFRSDENGNGTYSAVVSYQDIGKWQIFEIARHPGGNPKDTQNMTVILRGTNTAISLPDL